MPEILLATHNAGKVREIRQLAACAGWRWHGLDDFPPVPEAVEDAATFAENARRKALHYAAATGLPTLADDSGLEVDCLGGAPGVHSARYAGAPRDDAANNRKLVAALAGVPLEQRTARFRCAMAFARPGTALAQTQGIVEGLIIDEPRGDNGFGYDPHFLLPELDKTMAELPPKEKNALSHRGQALRAMLPEIARILEAERRAESGTSL
ncbi:MAG: XTP/dITP diphosphatase [Phycisphaerae bacterium]